VYRERWYRDILSSERFHALSLKEDESDIWISFSRILVGEDVRRIASERLRSDRAAIKEWINLYPAFRTSFDPLPFEASAPEPVRKMLKAGLAAGVGPMASVAGAIAESLGTELLSLTANDNSQSFEFIIENGGDIWLSVERPIIVGVYAGISSLSGKLGLRIEPELCPLGVCTSSAKVGPSISLGNADAFLIASADAALADALATEFGNRVRTRSDLEEAVNAAAARPGVVMALGIMADHVAAAGSLEMVPIKI
jgi:ApbE superfamily uncharacterized protein (UPF0280 family)